MRGKLAVLGGIFAMALTLGLGGMVGSDDGAADGHVSQQILADSKGPGSPSPAPSPVPTP
ncbi:hypothetical protein [Streptomyces sp. NBC_00503]|uniref:hypothetical protein n=1 Tax=Streptomyces sp. NBC_00503 TaxID=2903659 RepID=UPI002E8086EC|nr:hypothetical protein [Streptomyces sp. NBC_00503]WUD82725.1 hypothetical protein OG490_20455 [Streptomyces sp. NBC_00503]